MTDPPELGELIPRLTRSTISDDERAALYHAAMQGHQLPLGVKRWKPRTHREWPLDHQLGVRIVDALECPGCGHQAPPHEAGPLPCDGCGQVYLVAPEGSVE